METLKFLNPVSLDTFMKIVMASKPSSCLLDPIPTKLMKELLPVPSYVDDNKQLPILHMCTKFGSNKASTEKAKH